MHDFKITVMTPEILADKFPDVFKAIRDEGFATGKIAGKAEGEIVGRNQADLYNRYMAQSTQPVQPQSTQTHRKNFEVLTKEYMEENKCSKGKAMMACAKSHPAEHQDFINRTNSK